MPTTEWFLLGQAGEGLTPLTSSELTSGRALHRLCADRLTGLIKHARSCFSLKQCGWANTELRSQIWQDPCQREPIKDKWEMSSADRSKISCAFSDLLKTLTKAGIFSHAHHLGLIVPPDHKSIKLNNYN